MTGSTVPGGRADVWSSRNIWLVCIAALLAAGVHMFPYLRARANARDDYSFTGNLTVSPDYMQYRVWERQALREGPVVSNRFTIEPNRPHLPVFFYWAVARVGNALGMSAESVYAWSGAFFAFGLAFVVWALVARYIADPVMRWWSYFAIMVGEGLGGFIKLLDITPVIKDIGALRQFLLDPSIRYPVFEDYRAHYIYRSLLDSHFLLLWIIGLLAVLALARALERYSTGRAVVAAVAFAGMTVFHVHEGVVLLAVAAMAVLCAWGQEEERRTALKLLAWTGAAVVGSYGVLGSIYAGSGLKLPAWHAAPIPFITVVIAFPISWGLMAIGGRRYWLAAGVRERFLVAWAAACLMITLAGPYHPFPDRGTLTMSVPVVLIGSIIFYQWFGRPGRLASAIALFVFLPGPIWQASRMMGMSNFRTDAPYTYLSPGHREVIDSLSRQATTEHVLLTLTPELLWLAPDFPGKLYVGHFYLTPGFRERSERLQRALVMPDTMTSLLRDAGADWLFVARGKDFVKLDQLPQLTRVIDAEPGTLYRVSR